MKKSKSSTLKTLTIILIITLSDNAMADEALPGCDGLKNTYLGRDGWIFESWEMQDSYNFTAAEEYKKLQEGLKSRGVELISLPIPSRPYAYIDMLDQKKYPDLKFSKSKYKQSWVNMMALAKKFGMNVVDIMPIIEKFAVSTRGENFFYNGDHHWTTSGAQAAAQVASQYILAASSKDRISISYSDKSLTEFAGEPYSGSFNYHYITSCKAKINNLKTYKISIKSSENNLLGDDVPDIGIFGDSFGLTDPDNNFAEYLEYYTHAKVANFSTEGGGFFGAMMGYFAIPSINKNLPKFIIIPSQGWLQSDPFLYKETIATLNLCEAKVNGSERSIPIPGNGIWIKNIYNNSKATKYSVIKLKFDNENSKFSVKFNLADGSSVSRDIDRYFPASYKGSRTDYYIPVPESGNITSIDIQSRDEKSLSKSVYTQLCKA